MSRGALLAMAAAAGAGGFPVLHPLHSSQTACKHANQPTKRWAQVSRRDLLVPPAAQRALAAVLGARRLELDIGHMGVAPCAGALWGALLETVGAGEVIARVKGASAAAGGGGE